MHNIYMATEFGSRKYSISKERDWERERERRQQDWQRKQKRQLSVTSRCAFDTRSAIYRFILHIYTIPYFIDWGSTATKTQNDFYLIFAPVFRANKFRILRFISILHAFQFVLAFFAVTLGECRMFLVEFRVIFFVSGSFSIFFLLSPSFSLSLYFFDMHSTACVLHVKGISRQQLVHSSWKCSVTVSGRWAWLFV